MARTSVPSAEATIGALSSRQHGVVTRAALLEAGLTRDRIDGLVRSDRLRLLHRGVYLNGALVGPLEPPLAREMAAVLACGPGAVVSHESAAAMWKISSPARARIVHVTVPGTDRGRRPGLRPHRVARLAAEDATVLEGIPVTAPARTLVDLAGCITPRSLEQAVAEAERSGLADPAAISAALERRPRATGTSVLKRLIDERRAPAFTRSEAEERFLALIRRGGLQLPETNVRVHGHEVDFLWRRERVAVEVDGFAFHSSRESFERDRRRDARLTTSGVRTIRVTWRQLDQEPHQVLVHVAQVLARSGSER